MTVGRAVRAALVAAAALTSCGEKQEQVPAVSAAEVRALVAAGVGAAGGSVAVPRLITSRSHGPTLRIGTTAPSARDGLLAAVPLFRFVSAELSAFCPKPAVLRCRPALQASGSLLRHGSVGRVVRAVHLLVRAKYDARPLVRRRGRNAFDIVTRNGELLGAVRAHGQTVRLSLGGPPPPPRGGAPSGIRGIVVEAGPEALAAMRRSLSPKARSALAGIRRLLVVARL